MVEIFAKNSICNYCKSIRFFLVLHTTMISVIANCNDTYIDLPLYMHKWLQKVWGLRLAVHAQLARAAWHEDSGRVLHVHSCQINRKVRTWWMQSFSCRRCMYEIVLRHISHKWEGNCCKIICNLALCARRALSVFIETGDYRKKSLFQK